MFDRQSYNGIITVSKTVDVGSIPTWRVQKLNISECSSALHLCKRNSSEKGIKQNVLKFVRINEIGQMPLGLHYQSRKSQ